MGEQTDIYLFKVSIEKQENIANKLEKIFLIQLLLSVLGLIFIVDPPLGQKFSEVRLIAIDANLIQTILPFILIYDFVRFGYLLGVYLDIRHEVDDSIKPILKISKSTRISYIKRLLTPVSTTEVIYLLASRQIRLYDIAYIVFLIIIILTLILNHAVVIFFLFFVFGNIIFQVITLFIFVLILLGCYSQFIREVPYNYVRKFSVVTLLLGVVLGIVLLIIYRLGFVGAV